MMWTDAGSNILDTRTPGWSKDEPTPICPVCNWWAGYAHELGSGYGEKRKVLFCGAEWQRILAWVNFGVTMAWDAYRDEPQC